jgi:hypothetical protein
MGKIAAKCQEIQLGPLFACRRFAVDHPKLKSERPDGASNAALKTDSSSPDAPHFKRLFDLKEILEKLTWQSYLKNETWQPEKRRVSYHDKQCGQSLFSRSRKRLSKRHFN